MSLSDKLDSLNIALRRWRRITPLALLSQQLCLASRTQRQRGGDHFGSKGGWRKNITGGFGHTLTPLLRGKYGEEREMTKRHEQLDVPLKRGRQFVCRDSKRPSARKRTPFRRPFLPFVLHGRGGGACLHLPFGGFGDDASPECATWGP